MSAFIITSIDTTVPTSSVAQVTVFDRDHSGARGVAVFSHVFNSLAVTNAQLIADVTSLADVAATADLNAQPLDALIGMTFPLPA